MGRFIWLVALSLLVGACDDHDRGAEGTPSAQGRLSPLSPATFADTGWSHRAEGDPSIATVAGAPITRSALEAAIAADPTMKPRQALERLVELEVLAQHGVRQGHLDDEPVHRAWQQALVQQWIRGEFEAHTTSDSIPLPTVRRLYTMPAVRKLYDHADAWNMAHLFFTCCDPKIEDCADAEVHACFSDAAAAIQEVYGEVKERLTGIEGQAEVVAERMEQYRKDVELRLPQLAFRRRPFYYDPSKTHGEQKGYNIITEPVARTVIEAAQGFLQEPVQSPFGWHIIVQLDHDPEDRRGPDDPSVIADIRAKAFPRYRHGRFREVLGRLTEAYGVTVDEQALGALGP